METSSAFGSAGSRRDPDPRLEQPFDTIVVGSGPGGATAALELTRRGQRVLVLERGEAAPVTGSFGQTVRELWMPGRGLLLSGKLGVLRAITLGGTSIYCWATAHDPRPGLFARHGVDLDEHLAAAKRELPIAPLPLELIGAAARRMMESATELGLEWQPLPKYLYQDRLGGPALGSYGAPSYEAKWNARMSVDEAIAGGATVLTGATVMRVLVEDGVATGVELVRRRRRLVAHGEMVVVAAGGIGTPVILRASGIRDAGQTFFCDPAVAVSGSLAGFRHEPELSMVAGMVDDDEGYMLADMSVPPWQYGVATAQGGRFDRLFSYRASPMLMVKVRDDTSGRITSRGGIDKELTEADRRKLSRGIELARRILEHAGARRISVSWCLATHPGATAPIGSVVDSDLQTSVRGLYVCDSSVIPEPWGLPPTLTVVALGKRLAAHLTARVRSGRRAPATAPVASPPAASPA